jgi:hypothetical protein
MMRSVTYLGDLVVFVLAALAGYWAVGVAGAGFGGDVRLVVALAVGYVVTLVVRHAARAGQGDQMV